MRAWALDRVDQLVWKPADGSGGKGIVIGPHAETEALDAVRLAVEAEPRSWIAQQPVALSTAPTYVETGMQPRHLDLRPFALNDGENVWVVPGGLTRVALNEGSLVVNSSQGARGRRRRAGGNERRRRSRVRAPRAPAVRHGAVRERAGGATAVTLDRQC